MADHPVPPLIPGEDLSVIPSTGDMITLKAKQYYAETLYKNVNAGASRRPLDDLREAVTTLEDVERTARRVLGGAHPLTETIDSELEKTRAALRNRETPGGA